MKKLCFDHPSKNLIIIDYLAVGGNHSPENLISETSSESDKAVEISWLRTSLNEDDV